MTIISTLVFIISSSVLIPLSTPVRASDPDNDTFFEYDYHQWVDSSSGAYYDYSETTDGKGRYEVVNWGPEEVLMSFSYSWDYWNNEGGSDDGGLSGTFSFSLLTRNYTSPMIDLDNPIYLDQDPHTLAQWVWISPDVKEGDIIRILDDEWEVTDTDFTLWSKFIPRKVIEVVSKGNWMRDDEYGLFDATYTDKLYFEKDSGMFFAERFEEWNEGYWQGDWAEFRYMIEIDVTKSSYGVEIDWVTFILTYTTIITVTFLIVFGIAYLIYRARWANRSFNFKRLDEYGPAAIPGGTEEVKFYRIWEMKDFPSVANSATDYFGPFLEHWAEKALLAKDRVAVATSKNLGMVGFALYNKEAKIGTVLCKNTELTETLRSFVKSKDFFTENRHMIRPTKEMMKNSMVMVHVRKARNEAYNVFETHNVYELTEIGPISYDTNLVRPMTKGDLPAVTKLAKKIYRTRSKRWMTSCLKSGDLSYVAELDGNIVGFGFACVSGEYGRLHTLGVAKEYRGRGIGKELHLARLKAMQLLGARTVIDEIADWNLASIRISTLSGFKPIGKMYVETTRSRRIKKNIIRR